MAKLPVSYFVEIDETITEKAVGTSDATNYLRALVLFADKRYGKGNHEIRTRRGVSYIAKLDGTAVLEARPFAPGR